MTVRLLLRLLLSTHRQRTIPAAMWTSVLHVSNKEDLPLYLNLRDLSKLLSVLFPVCLSLYLSLLPRQGIIGLNFPQNGNFHLQCSIGPS